MLASEIQTSPLEDASTVARLGTVAAALKAPALPPGQDNKGLLCSSFQLLLSVNVSVVVVVVVGVGGGGGGGGGGGINVAAP